VIDEEEGRDESREMMDKRKKMRSRDDQPRK
jgi:hypothetical protein